MAAFCHVCNFSAILSSVIVVYSYADGVDINCGCPQRYHTELILITDDIVGFVEMLIFYSFL